MKRQYRFPFICTAKFKGKCPETKRAIHKGDIIGWYPCEKLAYHESSQHFKDIQAFLAAKSWDDYDEASYAAGCGV